MTIKYRLMLVLSALLLLALSIGFLGLYGMQRSNEGLRAVYQNRTKALDDVGLVDQLMQRSHLAIASALLDPTEANLRTETALIEGNIAESDRILSTFRAGKRSNEEILIVSRLTKIRSGLIQDGFIPALTGLRTLNLDGTSQLLKDQIVPMSRALNVELRALRSLQVEGAKAEYDNATWRYARIRTAMLVTIVLAAIATAGFGMTLIRTLYRQLGGEPGYSSEVVRNIASGNLGEDIFLMENDRGSLLFAMKAMQTKLADTVTAIRRTTVRVALGSSEIANGNIDLSSRTKRQAAALAETALSLQRLTLTVNINVDNARQVGVVAAKARDVAVQGGKVVNDVVGTMKLINDSAKKITDIISVIDGIAFQTNILALNAAVEAARAGEQGRGFAVVAAEVRTLAHRSAAAAKEIKNLIEDSAANAKKGAVLVDQAGLSMDNILVSVKRVSDLMVQITAASEEQAVGIEQVNRAITEMDGVTQENAILVDEAANAASTLEEEAAKLEKDIAFFKLHPNSTSLLSSSNRSRDTIHRLL